MQKNKNLDPLLFLKYPFSSSLQEDIFMFWLAKIFQKLLPQNCSPAH